MTRILWSLVEDMMTDSILVTITCPKCKRAYRVVQGSNWSVCPICTKPEKKR